MQDTHPINKNVQNLYLHQTELFHCYIDREHGREDSYLLLFKHSIPIKRDCFFNHLHDLAAVRLVLTLVVGGYARIVPGVLDVSVHKLEHGTATVEGGAESRRCVEMRIGW